MLDGRSDEEVAALYRAREPFYSRAHITIDTNGRTIDQVVAELVAMLREVPDVAQR
jgi:shikimate kinase